MIPEFPIPNKYINKHITKTNQTREDGLSESFEEIVNSNPIELIPGHTRKKEGKESR